MAKTLEDLSVDFLCHTVDHVVVVFQSCDVLLLRCILSWSGNLLEILSEECSLIKIIWIVLMIMVHHDCDSGFDG